MKRFFVFIILTLPLLVCGQSSFSGIVKDQKTKQPLPFATIISNTGIGEICDADGKFLIDTKKNISFLTISYVGYTTQKISVDLTTQYLTVLLEPSTERLNEVILVAKENPALQIIRNTIKNKDKNNTQKALNSFKYTAYNKLVVTANPDSINGNVDSVFVMKNDKKVFKRVDSTNYEFKKEIDKHHLYITEKIAEHTFKRGKNKKETVLASRMAGFKNPIYELLALNIEKFSFYDEIYTLLGNNYVNPLAKNALKKYDYKILDTIVSKGHSTYMIYYKPKKKGDVVGLEGVLYINFKNYALEKGIAELKGIVNVKASQTFKFIPQHDIWFPDETLIDIRKGKTKDNVSLFGGFVKFSDDSKQYDSIVSTKKMDPSDVSYLISKSNNSNITINQPVTVLNSASTIEIDELAADRDEAYWSKYRTDSITSRGIQTYVLIDSLSEAEGLEKKLDIGRKIIKGYFPTKYFDFDLSQLINFNNYEGFRLGFGGLTNTKFSRKLRLEAYTAYGFNDKVVKYHLGAATRLNKQNNTWLGISYTDDIQEDTSFSLINPRNLNISQFYGYKNYAVNIEHDIFPNVESKLKLSHGNYDTKFNYQFVNTDKSLSDYQLTVATLAIKWTPFSKYMNSPIGKIAIKNGFPKITTQLTKSFDNILDGDFNFTQINFKLEYTLKTIQNGSTSFLVQGGYINGDVPLSHLYNATPNYSLANPWRKRINFSGTDAFETMSFNEFISDRYVSLQARHNFERFKISTKFRPRLSLISRFAIGNIDNPTFHQGVSFSKMNKGYLESGFVLNHLFKGFGISSFYRYGAYNNPKFSDNLAVKLTYVLSLGF